MSRSSESVWPELLLQANIEQVRKAKQTSVVCGSAGGLTALLPCSQFDKVQESFFSLEQQTSTFQAHLQGLGKGTLGGFQGPVAQTSNVPAPSVIKQASDASAEHSVPPTSQSTSSTGPDSRAALSLRERSALHFSSTLGRLRRSGRRK